MVELQSQIKFTKLSGGKLTEASDEKDARIILMLLHHSQMKELNCDKGKRRTFNISLKHLVVVTLIPLHCQFC